MLSACSGRLGGDGRRGPGLGVWVVRIGRRQLSAERRGNVERLIAAPGAAAIKDVAVLGVGDHGTDFAGQAGGLPVAEREHALPRPGADAHAAAILLRAVEPIGETIVGGHVIDLGGGLVIPGAPTFGAIHADHGTLIAAEDHAVAVLGIDPELVVV